MAWPTASQTAVSMQAIACIAYQRGRSWSNVAGSIASHTRSVANASRPMTCGHQLVVQDGQDLGLERLVLVGVVGLADDPVGRADRG